MKDERVWSIDVVPAYAGGWAVRRPGAKRCLALFAGRAFAIRYALRIKSAYYVFVFARDVRVQYVLRTPVKRLLEEENWKT